MFRADAVGAALEPTKVMLAADDDQLGEHVDASRKRSTCSVTVDPSKFSVLDPKELS